MAERAGWWLAGAAVALGLAHLAVGTMIFDGLTLDALWFAGSGLALILGGMINLFAQLAHYDTGGRVLLRTANIGMAIFLGLLCSLAPEPQVIFGLILFAALAAMSLLRRPGTA